MQSIEVKLLLSYFSMRESSQCLPCSLVDTRVCLRLFSLHMATARSFYSPSGKCSPPPLLRMRREIRGARRHDIDISTIPVWCQRKRKTASVIKPWTCPLALRIKQFWYSAGLCICDSNSVKQRAMKAVQEQICGKSDHRMKAQTTPPPK